MFISYTISLLLTDVSGSDVAFLATVTLQLSSRIHPSLRTPIPILFLLIIITTLGALRPSSNYPLLMTISLPNASFTRHSIPYLISVSASEVRNLYLGPAFHRAVGHSALSVFPAGQALTGLIRSHYCPLDLPLWLIGVVAGGLILVSILSLLVSIYLSISHSHSSIPILCYAKQVQILVFYILLIYIIKSYFLLCNIYIGPL